MDRSENFDIELAKLTVQVLDSFKVQVMFLNRHANRPEPAIEEYGKSFQKLYKVLSLQEKVTKD